MIVFVDGVDGSGKSTLISRLLDELARQGAPAVLAPPLWTFLDPISAPEDFGAWVQETPGVEVGQHLLSAMAHRVDKLRADVDHKIIDRDAVVLVDRGPKTIVCSARAHARTNKPEGPCQLDQDSLTDHQQQDLEARVADLATAVDTTAIELQLVGNTNLMFDRLVKLEDLTPDYVRYLEAFAKEMTATPGWPALPRLALPAAARLDANTATAVTWLTDDGARSKPSASNPWSLR